MIINISKQNQVHFLSSSIGKESASKARDPGSIPGSGRSPGEEIGFPLQYSWASLVAQLVKNSPSLQETKILATGPKISWQIDGETMETVTEFISLGSKITADGGCSHEIK